MEGLLAFNFLNFLMRTSFFRIHFQVLLDVRFLVEFSIFSTLNEYSVPMPFWCQLILFKFPFVSQFSLTALKVSSFRLLASWPWCVWIWISLNLYKLRVYGASWVCKLMFTIKSETFSAMISSNTLSPSLSPFLLELPLHLHQYP